MGQSALHLAPLLTAGLGKTTNPLQGIGEGRRQLGLHQHTEGKAQTHACSSAAEFMWNRNTSHIYTYIYISIYNVHAHTYLCLYLQCSWSFLRPWYLSSRPFFLKKNTETVGPCFVCKSKSPPRDTQVPSQRRELSWIEKDTEGTQISHGE